VIARFALVALALAVAGASPASEKSVRMLLQQARVQSGAGNAPAALALLGDARALAPNSEDVLSAYAQVALAARLPVQAIGVLDPLTRLCPEVAQYYYLLGVAYLQVGGMEQAVVALREADRLEPSRTMTLVALGLALNSRKQHADAQPFLRRALAAEPENADVLAALAETEEALGNSAEAEAHAMRALTSASDHAPAHFVIGLVRMKQARYGEARDALLRAIAAQPDMAKAHYQVSLAFARLGDEARAAAHVEIYQDKMREMEAALKKVRGQ
jgi:tetratricopeptide (TPR) repeat protein